MGLHIWDATFMKKNYWHVSSVDVHSEILKKGLQLNDGMLFLFDIKKYAAYIACNQCGLSEYALFRITEIDESRLKPDDVGELTSHAQWIYDKPISEKHIEFVDCYRVSPHEIAKMQSSLINLAIGKRFKEN